MICPHCGKENPEGAEICQHCGERLTPARPPRLLSQIQGLIPAEPVITSGRLHDPDILLPDNSIPKQLPPPPPQEAQPESPEPPVTAMAAGVAVAAAADDAEVETEVAPESEPPELVPPPSSPSPKNVAQPLIAGLFFAVIILGGVWNLLAPAGAPLRPSVKDAYAFIEILPPNARVLLAWDYDPATQGEMQLLAQPILQHLQRKGASAVYMSLRPFGPNVAADAFNFSQRWRPPNMASAGPPPVAFGFIPGENAALRSLALSPVIASNQPAMSALATGMHPAETIDAFDLIIEFSSDMASSQQWVEQIAVRSETPLLVAASGAVAPALRPYEQTGQIRVLLSGYPDALAYEFLLGRKGPARAQATAQTLALLLLVGVLFLAAFRSLLRK